MTSNPPTLIGPVTTLTHWPLPMLATQAACGFPSPAEDFFREDDRLDLNDKLIANPPATFLVQADCGGSMVDYGIHDGDLLVVDRSLNPCHRSIVIAVVDGEFTVKRLYKRGNRIKLLAENPDYPAIEFKDGQELQIWGVVTSVIHRMVP